MRLVLDTNVILSGLLWHGAPHEILERVRSGALSLISSPILLAELAEVLGRAKFSTILTRAGLSRQHLLHEMRQFAEMVTPAPLPVAVCRDPDDDVVLAAALAAQVDLIVSGDADLLDLHEYQGIPIVTAAEALRLMGSQP